MKGRENKEEGRQTKREREGKLRQEWRKEDTIRGRCREDKTEGNAEEKMRKENRREKS